jgi:hypothetical protein
MFVRHMVTGRSLNSSRVGQTGPARARRYRTN